MIGVALALLRIGRGLSSDLLLLALLDPLIAPADSAGQSAHRRARGSPGARIAGYSAAYRAERGAARGSFDDMPLRWRGLGYGVGIRGGGLSSAGIESGLFDCP